MLDHAFQWRREIERMLLSGKKLTVSELMGRYCVGRYGRVGEHQNSLLQEQLECLERIAVSCEAQDRETVLTIIHEFGPYDAKHT